MHGNMFEKLKKGFQERFKKPPKKPSPKEKKIKEIHHTVTNAVKDGIIKIHTKVSDVMSKQVKTISPDDNLRNALDILSEYMITGIPVIKEGKLVGIVSEADIIKVMDIRKIIDSEKDEINVSELEKIKISEIMSKDVITINKKELISDASELMYRHHFNRLPVVSDKGRLIGIVTKEDIIRGITKEFFDKSMKSDKMKVIQTDIDKLIEIVENKGPITILDLSKELEVEPEQIEEWAKILEERGMIEIEYHPIGPPKLRKKK